MQFLCIFLFLVIIILLIKMKMMQKTAKEISEQFETIMQTDTNKRITISGNDRELRRLADNINKQLKILRKEYLRYRQGDFELKTAITNISHDIRTPLTAICGYLDLLQDNADMEKTKEYISIMKERAELMKQLTEELFRYSVLLSDHAEPKTEEILINQVLEDGIMSYCAAFTKRGISPEVHITEKKITAQLNKEYLARIIYNLLNNAVKYSDGNLQITLTDSGEMIFANTAKELSSVQVERLFDRFYTVKTARDSTGLGLSIARTLAEEMGGTISAEYKDDILSIRLTWNSMRKNI